MEGPVPELPEAKRGCNSRLRRRRQSGCSPPLGVTYPDCEEPQAKTESWRSLCQDRPRERAQAKLDRLRSTAKSTKNFQAPESCISSTLAFLLVLTQRLTSDSEVRADVGQPQRIPDAKRGWNPLRMPRDMRRFAHFSTGWT